MSSKKTSPFAMSRVQEGLDNLCTTSDIIWVVDTKIRYAGFRVFCTYIHEPSKRYYGVRSTYHQLLQEVVQVVELRWI